MNSSERYREFEFKPDGGTQTQDFYFTYARRLGARKVFSDGTETPGLRFSAWAPNALAVDVLFGRASNGYVADDGDGIDPTRPVLKLQRGPNDIWQSDILPSFSAFEGAPYMYRVANAQGSTVYRTDIFSRNQIGRGGSDPRVHIFPGIRPHLMVQKAAAWSRASTPSRKTLPQPAEHGFRKLNSGRANLSPD